MANQEPWPVDFLRKQGAKLEPELLAALEAYDSIQARRRVDEINLAQVVAAASSRSTLTLENGSGLLALLAGNYAVAREAIVKMSRATKWHIRFSSLLALHCAPKEFSCGIVRNLLADKSARVREMAASKALGLNLTELMPDLELASQNEAVASVLRGLKFSLAMLRDGYLLQPDEEDGIWLTVWVGDGARGQWYSASEFERRGLANLLSELTRGVVA